MKRHTLIALLASLAFGLPSFAAPDVQPGASQTQTKPDRATWVKRVRVARGQLSAAQQRYTDAMRSYARMMHRRRARGEEKLDVLEMRKTARNELTAAEQRIEVLLEEARRAGVPPGWLRAAMAQADPAAPAN